MSAPGPQLHVHPGDSSADSLRAAGIDGSVIVWSDLLHWGPLRPVADESSYRERGEFLSGITDGAMSPDQCADRGRRQDEALLAYRDFPETVLWFDACLYDQTILVRLLDWFARQDLTGHTLSLICVGEYPGLPTFCGLGELTPDQLAGLLPGRVPVTPAMLALGQRAWLALCADSPLASEQLAADDPSALPYLGEALVRFLEQFPASEDGLCRLERECLEAIAAGARSPVAVFRAASAAEPHPFFGDTTVWACLNQLAAGPAPLLAIAGPELRLPQWEARDLDRWQLTVTPAGQRVLAGQADAIALNGIDRWLGGTRLRPGHVWRWNRTERHLVAPSRS